VQPHSSDHPNLYADLAIPVAVDALFTYAIPPDLRPQARKGMRAVVPFGRRTVIGFIVEIKGSTTVRAPKSIVELLDAEPVISDELLDLTRWMASYYFAPWGEVLKTVLVRGSTTAGKRIVRLADHPDDGERSPQQRAILDHLRRAGSLSVRQLQKLLGRTSLHGALTELAGRGIIRIDDEAPGGGPRPNFESVIEIDAEARQRLERWLATPEAKREAQRRVAGALVSLDRTVIAVTDFLKNSAGSLSSLKTLARQGLVTIAKREARRAVEPEFYESALGAKDIVLNPHQRHSVGEVTAAMASGEFRAFLLHGVTGSGKTQVYIEAIREAFARGKTAIVLVPEISLTPQIVRRFKFHFKERVAVMHSRMSVGERYDTWRAAWEGRCSVVIGPRSAVFAPL
jgi:primosomal protein N' (replication factor Y)